MAEDYFAAMAQVEQRLANQLPPPEQGAESTLSNGTTSHLLTLVNGLQKEPLTDSQQELLSELQQRLAALAIGTNGTATPLVVNEPWTMELPLVAQPLP